MKILINIMGMLNLVYKASPLYIIAIIFSNVILAFLTVGELYINKIVLNSLVGNNISFIRILLCYCLYLVLNYFFRQIQLKLDHIFRFVKSINISKYIKCILFNKVRVMDLALYENNAFYNDYNRAINEIDNRTIAIVDSIAAFIKNLLVLILITSIFFDPIFIIASFITVVKHIIYLMKINKINYNVTMETSQNNRKLDYISWSYVKF